jgi:CxC2 like cysteine cluster associated with KDZ transposases
MGESDECIGQPCGCNRLLRTTRCTDCLQSATTCDLCFIEDHKNNPTHWAERWNGEFFERCDISELGHVITLGHHGETCKCVDYKDQSHLTSFILADVNGIHSTRLAFCRCTQSGDHVDQLLSARIFPASMVRPTTGFTFKLLETFHLDCLQSKKSAYDYIGALRRRTNNAFPDDVPVSRTLQIPQKSDQRLI